jgi:hypothetical protein
VTPARLPAERSADDLQTLRGLSRLLDEAITIPGLGIKVGLDAVIGLIPGLGDVAGGVAGAYALVVAHRLGAPASVLVRMLMNIGIDALVGTLPLLGDLFDVGWKANTRNLRLLERYTGAPHAVRKGSTGVLLLVLALLAAMVIGAVWVAVVVLKMLAGLAS